MRIDTQVWRWVFPLIGAILLTACARDASRIERALSEYCRSRAEGQYSVYCGVTGGDLLLNALRNPVFEKNLVAAGSNLEASGTVFLEIYVTSIEINSLKRQAEAVYLEKFSKELKTWAVHHQSKLEYIDQAWRVITDRILMTK